ncbi:MAG TPA: carbohydrate binding domain-containing protein [Planctomycetota bacterium]|jgi:hypothetical protein
MKTIISIATVVLAFAVLSRTTWAGEANLLKPTNSTENWRLEQHEEGKATAAVDGDALTIDVTNVDAELWHVQLFQTKLDLKAGKDYVLTFKAKASVARDISCVAGIDQEDWHNLGLEETASLATDWKDYKFTFTVGDPVKDNNRVGFMLGQAKGKVWLKDVTLTAK